MEDILFKSLVEDFSQLKEVEAILLAGSRVSEHHDMYSDYDVYIYANDLIDVDVRKKITNKYCKYMELGNTYWELEDDGILNNGTSIELIYRDLSIFNMIDDVCFEYKPSIGYTTCFWYNIVNSKILYDKNGIITEKISKYNIPYPEELKINIINQNYPLLKGYIPSYYEQIEKAILRNDVISIQHRITAFLASYFDIIFALNRCLHPGEKRLITYVKNFCEKIPVGFEEHLNQLIISTSHHYEQILPTLDIMIYQLSQLLFEEQLIK